MTDIETHIEGNVAGSEETILNTHHLHSPHTCATTLTLGRTQVIHEMRGTGGGQSLMMLVRPTRVVRAGALRVHGHSQMKLTGIHGDPRLANGQWKKSDDGCLDQGGLLHDVMVRVYRA